MLFVPQCAKGKQAFLFKQNKIGRRSESARPRGRAEWKAGRRAGSGGGGGGGVVGREL